LDLDKRLAKTNAASGTDKVKELLERRKTTGVEEGKKGRSKGRALKTG